MWTLVNHENLLTMIMVSESGTFKDWELEGLSVSRLEGQKVRLEDENYANQEQEKSSDHLYVY